ncbi:transcriptional regulator swi6, partial [Coemansia nantahalensis]
MDEYANSVYTAVYSDIHVYEMLCRGVAVMKRRSDSWLNATQLLKVAGIEKGRRTKILEREVLTGVHEKIQGGYGKYQGTWVPFARGVQLCRQYAVYDHVRAILEHDPTASGTRPDNTPSKADVRRFMKIAQTGAVRVTNGGPAASIKRDRLVGPAHPNIKRYRTASSTATSPLNSDILGGYQPATVAGPGHGAPSTPGYLHDDRVESLAQLASSASHFQHGLYSSPALCYSGDVPANPPSLACRPRAGIDELSSQTIAECDDSAERDDRTRLMQVFLNEDPNFVPDWLELDGSGDGKVSTAEGGAARRRINLDLAIDDQGHTSVHWAAALARIHVLDLFLCRGADPRRLNYDSESALVRAVQVTNNYETQTFPDLLELLHDTIPLTDKCNRTVLHHIALAAGAEGREKAARYYADCLLSWIVRLAGGYQIDADEGEADEAEPAAAQVDASSRSSHSSSDEPAKALPTPNQSSSPNGHPQTQTQSTEKTQALGDEDPLDGSGESGANADFAAFLNLQDVHGDTALNIAARTGDRAMVRMLLNAGASPTIQNRVGLCPLDFGVEQIAQTGDDSDLWEGDLAGVPDVAMSPTPSGRTRALLPQTPLRSAVRGANKNLLSSLMASCSAQSPMQGRGSGHDGASGLPGDLWSPVSAEQRVHQSVAKIQRLMADL